MKKIALVTGTSSGMGLATATALAKQEIHVVMLVRNYQKGLAALEKILTVAPKNVEMFQADLGDLTSLARFARHFQAKFSKLDILVNNAGILAFQRQETLDGFETMFGVHHLGHFALTNLLLPQLLNAPQGRIVTVASTAYRFGQINFADLNMTTNYSFVKAYSNSKLATVLATNELARRLQQTPVTANSLHPGFVNTSITQQFGGNILAKLPIVDQIFLTPEKGAATAIKLATDASLKTTSGKYFSVGKEQRLTSRAKNLVTQQKLWASSEALVQQVLPDFKAYSG